MAAGDEGEAEKCLHEGKVAHVACFVLTRGTQICDPYQHVPL